MYSKLTSFADFAEEVGVIEETLHGQWSTVMKNSSGEKYLFMDFVLFIALNRVIQLRGQPCDLHGRVVIQLHFKV